MPRRPDFELAPLSRRIGGLVIDWAASMAIAAGFFNFNEWAILGIFFVMTTILVGTAGSTIGHLLTGIGVRRLSGGLPGPYRAIGRQLLLCLVVPVLLTTPDGRSYHDALVGTTITKLR